MTAPSARAAPHVTVRCQFCQTWNRVNTARAVDRPKCGKCARPLLLDRPLPLTDEDFARTVADSEIPVLVDFYADWCAPCKIMAPIVDDLAAQTQGRALVAKLNTDRAPQISQQFDIRGIPTTIVFRAGREVARHVGAAARPVLDALLTKAESREG